MPRPVQPLPDQPLAIKLLNTTWSGDGGVVDLLADRDDVARWLASVGSTAQATEPLCEALRAARDAIEAVARNPADPAALRQLNALLARGTITRSLTSDGTAAREVTVDDAWQPGWLAADDLLEILAAHPDRIRQCAHPRCVLWFLDTSRNASRRWCSMAGCGNRSKAQQHYHRRRKASVR
ncbi:MAG TPA: CGNR zinc finger domain-containing protein [Ilumatobacteraceae bacterium]|nr:CGNR zinc finger domain-containing protein [Ilumatobacteraceae bacterium]